MQHIVQCHTNPPFLNLTKFISSVLIKCILAHFQLQVYSLTFCGLMHLNATEQFMVAFVVPSQAFEHAFVERNIHVCNEMKARCIYYFYYALWFMFAFTYKGIIKFDSIPKLQWFYKFRSKPSQ